MSPTKSRLPLPTKRPRPPAADSPRLSMKMILPGAQHVSSNSFARGPGGPIIIQGDANALFAINQRVKRDVRAYITGRIEALDKAGHELIEPTGKNFVFVLRLEDPEEKVVCSDDDKKALEEYINAYEEEEGDLKRNTQILKASLSKQKPLLIGLPAIEEAEVEISGDVKRGMEQYINEDKEEEKIKPAKKFSGIKSIKKRKLTITLETIQEFEEPLSLKLSWYAHSKLKNVRGRPRIPRTSNGPSLASLIATAKASDFKPAPPSKTTALSKSKPKTIGLVHSTKLPSLAKLISSADPADFPLPDPDADEIRDLDPNGYTDVIDITGARIVRKYDYTHKYAFKVVRERFEERNEGGDKQAARERKTKKKGRIGESWLRLEVIYEEADEEQEIFHPSKPTKFKVKRRERGAWWLSQGVELSVVPNSNDGIVQGLDEDAITPAEPLTAAALQNHTNTTIPALAPSSRIINIRYASMNDVWGEISSLSTSNSGIVSKSSSAKTTETAATEHSLLIEALDLQGLPAQKAGIGDCDVDTRSVGDGFDEKGSSLKGDHQQCHVLLPKFQSAQYAGIAVEAKRLQKDQKASRYSYLLGKFKGQAKKMRGKVSVSKKKASRKLRTVFGCA